MGFPAWWKGLSGQQRRQQGQWAQLRGGLETITPTLLAGWVHHPSIPFAEVRLVCGPHLIGQARIEGHRPDVEAHLGLPGPFGFAMEIAEDLPLVELRDPPQFLAITADGSARVPLCKLGSTPAATTEWLQLALRPEFRGLRGHFDGLAPGEQAVHGWCHRADGGLASIWLHAAGLEPRQLDCSEYRPGMGSQGHPDQCGFFLPLEAWPEAAGKEIWASHDREGKLRLPQNHSVVMPLVVSDLMPSPAREQSLRLEPELVLPTSVPDDLRHHWETLEQFRRLLDRLEAEPPSISPAQPGSPLSSRSARFRLWR